MSSLLVLAVLKLTLRLELGPEYDSNANRAEVLANAIMPADTPTGSFLVRTTGRGGLQWRSGKNVLRASALLGGKVFFNPAVQDQNMFIAQLGVEDRIRVARHVELGFGGDYYDVTQMSVAGPCAFRSCDRHRDFRNGAALARLTFIDDPGSISLSGGYRGFQWKPDRAFDFHAGQASFLATVRLFAGPSDREHEIDLTAGYHMERRLYSGLREVNNCQPGQPLADTCLGNDGAQRNDWFHDALVDITYVRIVLLSLSYAIQLNQSNSFGQSLLRHVVTLKLSTRLFWQLYLTVKGQLLVNRYLDPVLLDRQVNSQTFLSIDEENRNAFVVDLERPIGKTGLAVEARYSVYTNELSSSPASFLRQVVYLGLSYRIGR
jgi:hypothetical protein